MHGVSRWGGATTLFAEQTEQGDDEDGDDVIDGKGDDDDYKMGRGNHAFCCIDRTG